MHFIKISLIILLINFQIVQGNNVYVAFRIDDLGIDDIDVYKKILPLFDSYGIPLTIGVVPFKLVGKDIRSSITPEIKDLIIPYIHNGIVQIGLHGYLHRNTYLKDGIVSEFFKLDSTKQHTFIEWGKYSLEENLNINLKLFIPPYNTYDDITTSILNKQKFEVISAARYGSIGFKTKNIKYIPYTISLNGFLKLLRSNQSYKTYKQDVLFIVLFHGTDFTFYNSKINLDYGSITSDISISDLEFLLYEVRARQYKCLTIDSLSKLNIDFSNTRLQKTYFPNPVFPLPTFLVNTFQGSYSHYSKCEIMFQRIGLPIFYYLIVILFGFITFRLIIKRLNYSYLNKIIGFVCALLLFLILIGRIHSVGIMLLVYFLSLLVFKTVNRTRIFGFFSKFSNN